MQIEYSKHHTETLRNNLGFSGHQLLDLALLLWSYTASNIVLFFDRLIIILRIVDVHLKHTTTLISVALRPTIIQWFLYLRELPLQLFEEVKLS